MTQTPTQNEIDTHQKEMSMASFLPSCTYMYVNKNVQTSM